MRTVDCRCAELSYFRNHRLPIPTHDCEYIARRNENVLLAERVANRVGHPRRQATAWSRAFFAEMNRLMPVVR